MWCILRGLEQSFFNLKTKIYLLYFSDVLYVPQLQNNLLSVLFLDPYFSNPVYQNCTGKTIANLPVEYSSSSNDQYHMTNSWQGCTFLTSSSMSLKSCIIRESQTISIWSNKASTFSATLLLRSLMLAHWLATPNG